MHPVIVRNVIIGEGMPKVCVPIVGKTRNDILQTAREILEVPADLVEWRADWFESVFEIEKVKTVLKDLRQVLGELPLLFTFRTKAEGGEREITAEQYESLNRAIIASGDVELIDVEVFTAKEEVAGLIDVAHRHNVKVVGSNHDFAKTPDRKEIVQRLRHMQSLDVDIPKIAVMPQNRKDVLTLLSATEEMMTNYADRPIITMSMNGLGSVSRVSGEMFGSAVTFGAVKKASAPGQMDVRELKNILEILHRACYQ